MNRKDILGNEIKSFAELTVDERAEIGKCV